MFTFGTLCANVNMLTFSPRDDIDVIPSKFVSDRMNQITDEFNHHFVLPGIS